MGDVIVKQCIRKYCSRKYECNDVVCNFKPETVQKCTDISDKIFFELKQLVNTKNLVSNWIVKQKNGSGKTWWCRLLEVEKKAQNGKKVVYVLTLRWDDYRSVNNLLKKNNINFLSELTKKAKETKLFHHFGEERGTPHMHGNIGMIQFVECRNMDGEIPHTILSCKKLWYPDETTNSMDINSPFHQGKSCYEECPNEKTVENRPGKVLPLSTTKRNIIGSEILKELENEISQEEKVEKLLNHLEKGKHFRIKEVLDGTVQPSLIAEVFWAWIMKVEYINANL